MKELFIGISELKAALKKSVESLQAGEVDHIIILRNNKAVGVMVSFEDYQAMSAAIEAHGTWIAEQRELERVLTLKESPERHPTLYAKERIQNDLREEARIIRSEESDG